MAFPSEAGHTNLPNGNFSPTIFSKKVQKAYRKTAVTAGITNTDYFGEISNMGDSVRILKEPTVTVKEYKRGTVLEAEDLQDDDFSLTVTQANYFNFGVDALEKHQSHVDFMDLATSSAMYALRDGMDRSNLGYLSGYQRNSTTGIWSPRTASEGTKADAGADSDELFATNKLAYGSFGELTNPAFSIPLAPKSDGTVFSPLKILGRIQRQMAQANVPMENRWVVVDPVFMEILMDEDSKYLNADYVDGNGGTLVNGKVNSQRIRGFDVHVSNNLPTLGNGAETISSTGSASNYGVIVAGHKGAVATADQITKSEKYRPHDGFSDWMKGLQLYGRKTLRPESIYTVIYNVA